MSRFKEWDQFLAVFFWHFISTFMARAAVSGCILYTGIICTSAAYVYQTAARRATVYLTNVHYWACVYMYADVRCLNGDIDSSRGARSGK